MPSRGRVAVPVKPDMRPGEELSGETGDQEGLLLKISRLQRLSRSQKENTTS
jgi:hypothetical protein